MEDVCVLAVAGAARIANLRSDAGNLAEQLIEYASVAMTMQGLRLQSSELNIQDSALPFAQTVVGTVDEVAVEPFARHAPAIVNGSCLALEGVVVGDDHAAFTGGHELAGLKAEGCGGAKGAYFAAAPFAAVSMGRVFDQSDPVALGDFLQAVKICGMSAHVDGDDGLGPRSDSGFGQRRIEIVALRIDINKHGKRIGEEHGASGGDEGEVRNDDLVTVIDSERSHGDFERGGAVGDGEAVLGAVIFRKGLLEFEGFGAGSAPPDAAFENFLQGAALVV